MADTPKARGWLDLALGFVVGLVAAGLALAALNAVAGWRHVGAWQRAIDDRDAAQVDAMLLRHIALSQEAIKDEWPLESGRLLAFSTTPAVYEHDLDYCVHLLEHREVDRFNALRAATPFLTLDLAGASLAGLDLRNADFHSAILEGTDFKGADVSNASFFRARLDGADFSGATVTGASFAQAEMLNTTLNGIRGTGPDFSQAILVNASMTGVTELKDARFLFTELGQCNLEGSRFPQAVFDGADLTLGSAVNADFSQTAGMDAVVFTGVNLGGTRWNFDVVDRPWLVGAQGLSIETIRRMRDHGGIIDPRELLRRIDREIVDGFRAQVAQSGDIPDDQREAVLLDLLKQYWMR